MQSKQLTVTYFYLSLQPGVRCTSRKKPSLEGQPAGHLWTGMGNHLVTTRAIPLMARRTACPKCVTSGFGGCHPFRGGWMQGINPLGGKGCGGKYLLSDQMQRAHKSKTDPVNLSSASPQFGSKTKQFAQLCSLHIKGWKVCTGNCKLLTYASFEHEITELGRLLCWL